MVLEITETTAMTEVAPSLENLARLRMRGFGLQPATTNRVPFNTGKVKEEKGSNNAGLNTPSSFSPSRNIYPCSSTR